VFVRKKVAGRERCHEEATRIAPRPAEPHGLRRCGGPEHPAGLFLSGYRTSNRTQRLLLTSGRRPSSDFTLLDRAMNATLKPLADAGFANNPVST